MAVVIDGKAVAEEVHREVQGKVTWLRDRGVVPTLAVVLVGKDPASLSYVTAKERTCERLGMRSLDHRLEERTTTAELVDLVRGLSQDPGVHGILVQLPLPTHVDQRAVLEAIAPEKDVDGFLPTSAGALFTGRPTFVPCTPAGVMRLLDYYAIPLAGKHAVVVGRSLTVGRPLALLLLERNCTVTICHSRTPDLSTHTLQADILIAAVGRAHLVRGDMIKPGAVVIDVGVNRVEDPVSPKGYRLVGDVEFEAAKERAAYLTPVPGGVGPMTIAMLMHNTVTAALRVWERHSRQEAPF